MVPYAKGAALRCCWRACPASTACAAPLSQVASTSRIAGRCDAKQRRGIATSTSRHRYIPEVNDGGAKAKDLLRKATRLRTSAELYDLTGKTGRIFLKSPELADKIVKAMKLDEMPKPVTVLDLYAGQGTLSKALLAHPNVERVIAVEHMKRYIPDVQQLVETSAGRLSHIALDPFWWDTYGVMKERGLLDHIEKTPWADPHPQLVITGVIPNNINGERLLIQQMNCITGNLWLYDYGRFSSHFIISRTFKQRLTAKIGEKIRQKSAVLLEFLADTHTSLPESDFEPQSDNFENYRRPYASTVLRPQTIPKDHHYSLMTFKPKYEAGKTSKGSSKGWAGGEEHDDMQILEYLAKNLFIRAGYPWIKSLRYLAAGGEKIAEYVEKNGHYVDPTKKPKDLTNTEWGYLVDGFKSWPFRPTDLEQTDILDADQASKES